MFNYYVYINIVSCEPIISSFHLLNNFKILIWSSVAFLIYFFIIISHLAFFLCSSKAPNNVSSLKLTNDESWVSLVDQMVKYLPEKKETWAWYLGREDPWRRAWPLQYSWLKNSMDRGAYWATVHGVAKNQTWLCD